MTQQEVWYRYDETQYAGGVDEYGDPIPGSRGPLAVTRSSYPVVRHTPKGVQLDMGDGTQRFVSHSWIKQFACATDEAARTSFLARKRREAGIYKARAQQAVCAGIVLKQRMNERLGGFLGGDFVQYQAEHYEIERHLPHPPPLPSLDSPHFLGRKVPLTKVLRALAAQEGNDGEEGNALQAAADYIEALLQYARQASA